VRCVLKNGHDLVAKPSEGALMNDVATVGALDFRLVRSVPAPVFITRTLPPRSVRPVVAALECGRTEPRHEALNREILDVAAGISLFGFRELHILHVWDLWGEQLLRSRTVGQASQEVDEMVRAERETHEAWLEEVVSDFRDSLPPDKQAALEPKIHLVKGPTREVIAAASRELDPHLLVMGSIARRGLQGFVLGNTAEVLLRKTEASVLIVKPADFIPPGG
jgi:nucleotide-binding universal stress UspA family protein